MQERGVEGDAAGDVHEGRATAHGARRRAQQAAGQARRRQARAQGAGVLKTSFISVVN